MTPPTLRIAARPLRTCLLLLAPLALALVASSAAPPAAAPADSAAAPAAPAAAPAKSKPAKPAPLPQQYLDWLAEVDVLISKEEKATFMALAEDYQRDAFIDRFWRARDPYPDTARNERKERWDALVATARSEYGGLEDERSKVLLLNGPPAGALISKCRLIWPLEIWFYHGSDQMRGDFYLVFAQLYGMGRYRLWDPTRGVSTLGQFVSAENAPGDLLQQIGSGCRDGDQIAGILGHLLNRGVLDYNVTVSRVLEKPRPPSGEWSSTFSSYSTDIPADAPPLDVSLEVRFPSRYQNRTVLQGILGVATTSAGTAELGGVKSYNFLVTGEVIHERALFESFRYKFDFPAEQITGDRIPLVFERYLRPGKYTLVTRIEDVNGKRLGRRQIELEVPQLAGNATPPPPSDPQTAELLAEATAAISTGDTTIKLVAPRGEMQLGMTRFDTLTTGPDIAEVAFLLNGREVLRKARPPYSVELDLGKLPRTHELAAVAKDAAGTTLAQDELVINSGAHRFRVHLAEPERGKHYERSLRAVVELELPEGGELERLELYYGETLLATLYGPPWVQPIVLPANAGLSYVRAVAYLADGNTTEDVVFVNAPNYLEEVEIQFVELYTSVLDDDGHPVDGLTEADFSVLEDGTPQTVSRFDKVENLPVHVAALLDISASMEPSLAQAQEAAIGFFQQVIKPKDRGAVITFNDRPNLAAKFTNDIRTLAGGLAGLKAERGTALWDSVIFTLFYFNGVRGQRALVLLSDGADEGSRFSFDQALEYAQRSGVAIYTIGLDIPLKQLTARRQLAKLASQTGGRSFLVKSAAELAPLYASIERELRSRYLLAYQSTSTAPAGAFRTVEVKMKPRGLEAKTMRGYYP
jgi:Ca-activated chloride channel family protein